MGARKVNNSWKQIQFPPAFHQRAMGALIWHWVVHLMAKQRNWFGDSPSLRKWAQLSYGRQFKICLLFLSVVISDKHVYRKKSAETGMISFVVAVLRALGRTIVWFLSHSIHKVLLQLLRSWEGVANSNCQHEWRNCFGVEFGCDRRFYHWSTTFPSWHLHITNLAQLFK